MDLSQTIGLKGTKWAATTLSLPKAGEALPHTHALTHRGV